MHLALYQPDIAPNVGSFIRLAACLGLKLHIIEPCGFPWDERKIRRVAMDYFDKAAPTRHASWEDFLAWRGASQRIILLTTKAAQVYTEITYQPDDILLLGRESSGVPQEVHEAADARVMIPMAEGFRSLNVVLAAAMVAGEGLRQVNALSI